MMQVSQLHQNWWSAATLLLPPNQIPGLERTLAGLIRPELAPVHAVTTPLGASHSTDQTWASCPPGLDKLQEQH